MTQPATLSIVIPVYRGQDTIAHVVKEIIDVLGRDGEAGLALTEIVLVHDGAIDDSAEVLRTLDEAYQEVHVVWLSRNFGQHAATLAGCASSLGDWIVTVDEDGLHDPADIPRLYEAAQRTGLGLAYGRPRVHTHSRWRRWSSALAKFVAERLLGVRGASKFSSFRIMDGYTTRALAAYCAHGVYLDVALLWVFEDADVVEVGFRNEMRTSGSGYNLARLLSHFRRMVLTAGPRPLRLASVFGLVAACAGLVGSVLLVILGLSGAVSVPGWTSVMAALSAFFGTVLVVLGVIAEYLAVSLAAVSGRPLYLIRDPPAKPPQ